MRRVISSELINKQIDICGEIRKLLENGQTQPLAMVDTYGCQQNESDSEKLRGFLASMGYGFTEDEYAADVVVINSCAVREHAEMRVLGNVGALTHTKRGNGNQIIAVCGCMVQQKHMAEKLRNSYRHVDLVFGPHALWRFPEFMLRLLTGHGRIIEIEDSEGEIAEGLPQSRDGKVRAWLSVMYGCNNFCSYCVVPYVRGRERSRAFADIIAEARDLVDAGCKDITLLGQNVNSYGRGDESGDYDFTDLIYAVNAIPGDFLIRFMTSHPKDATKRLFEAMANCEKCAKHIHLPVQAGSDRILRDMNRGYTSADYLRLLYGARSLMPELVVTSDIIVGFPGETDEDFEDTIKLVKEARFDALFTFIYSKREGTPAARMPDPFTREEKQRRFDRLIETQNAISGEKHAEYLGKTVRVLIDGSGGNKSYNLTSRTNGGRLVHLRGGDELIGRFADAKITDSNTWALYGEIVDSYGGNDG